jgi:hypothetical protein
MKKSILTSVFLFINFIIFGQCPSTVSLAATQKCIQLTWNILPNPVPSTVTYSGITFNMPTVAGTVVTYDNPNDNGACGSFSTPGGQIVVTINGNNCTYNSGILPLNFLNFKGTLNNNQLNLGWSTANEVNVASFKVEVSNDAETWVSHILNINNLSERSNTKTYTATVSNLTTEANYMRIVGVDLDGSETKTKIFSPNKQVAYDVSFAPNPSEGNIISFSCIGCSEKGSALDFNTMDGKTVKSFTNKFNGDILDVSDLGQGVYFIRVNDAVAQPSVIKFIKR